MPDKFTSQITVEVFCGLTLRSEDVVEQVKILRGHGVNVLNGITAVAASDKGAVRVALWHDEATGKDHFEVSQELWQGVGDKQFIARGIVGEALPGKSDENADALALLAQIQHAENDFAGAEINLKKAIFIAGDVPDLLNNLAIAVKRQDRPEDAVKIYERALRVSPNHPEIICNLGSANIANGNVGIAEKLFRDALHVAPDHPKALHNLGLLLLNHEEFEEGWNFYSRSVEQGLSNGNEFASAATLWRGEPLGGSRLLVWRNQGVGDELLYAGMLPELINLGAKVLYITDSRMAPLMQRSFPSVQVSVLESAGTHLANEQNILAQCPIHLLGAQLRRSLDDFPRHTGYIKADAARTARLRSKYAQNGRPVVGISWRSKAPYSGSIKSSDLADWQPVLMQEDIAFVSLQYGGFAEDIDRVQEKLGVPIINDPEIDPVADIDGCAAQIASMDLVISTSSTTVHMAGAQGVPVWTLLPKHGLSLWYWFDHRDDCPWYPSMKLFRQQKQGDWHGLLQHVGAELSSFLHTL